MLAYMLAPKFIILYVYIISVIYTQFRGQVRLKFLRQIVNHSTLMAPINVFMYLFSKVPNKPFIDKQAFPQLSVLRNNWQIIREEAAQLVQQGYIKTSDNHDDMGFNSFFKRGWKRFYIKWYDDFLPSAQKLCPKTVSLLKTVPGINGAMFTLLPKHGVLKPHRDPYAGSIRYHLGIMTPNTEKCCIYIDGTPYAWKDGEDILFDETYIHWAKNETDSDRIILFCDIERPMNNKIATAINRFINQYIMSESSTQNIETDRIGLFNKIYKYYYYIAAWSTLLKKKNKYFYRFLQYAGIMGLVYWIFF